MQQKLSYTNSKLDETRLSEIEKDCRETLQESISSAARTNALAQTTAEHLSAQTEQIVRIHRDTEQIGQTLETTDYLLKGMKSWWSSFTQMFTSPPQPVEVTETPRFQQPVITPEPSKSLKRPLSEEEKDLDTLSSLLSEMKVRAIAAGHELQYHNTKLEDIKEGVDRNKRMVERQQRDLASLMK